MFGGPDRDERKHDLGAFQAVNRCCLDIARLDLQVGPLDEVLLDPDGSAGPSVAGARVSGARVSGARVSGARVSGARVSGARVSGARVSGARLSGD